ncbi:CHAT domain-containing protein [Microcoleus sp. T3_A4]|uniref:CHAT domain-containing protein n=1 Tax=Microcoleus sp. T3_A4 TaxID=2818968 RepID=UPI002FD0398B
MDIVALMAFLNPCLPFLLKLGEKSAESAAGKVGEDIWDKAKKIWEKLQLPVEAKEDAKIAAQQLAAKPESEPRKAVFQEELETLLKENPSVAAAIAQILKEDSNRTSGSGIIQNVAGSQNQTIGTVSGGNVVGPMSGGQVFYDFKGNIASGAPVHQGEASETPPPAIPATNTQQKVKTILILAANPKGTSQLRLSEEVREIQSGLKRTHRQDAFAIQQQWAVRSRDVYQTLLDYKPQIVHFSGHGSGAEGLVLENDAGQAQLISTEALFNLFELFGQQIECVVLNACYSEVQAKAIAKHIPYVIGMNKAVGDKAAIEFAIGFYEAIASGRSVEFAYKLGCTAIQMAGIPEHLTPVIERKLV